MSEADSVAACSRDLAELRRLDDVLHKAMRLVTGRLEKAAHDIVMDGRAMANPCCERWGIGFSRFDLDPLEAVFFVSCPRHGGASPSNDLHFGVYQLDKELAKMDGRDAWA